MMLAKVSRIVVRAISSNARGTTDITSDLPSASCSNHPSGVRGRAPRCKINRPETMQRRRKI
eukprot:3859344-Rhodomonas_salina.3